MVDGLEERVGSVADVEGAARDVANDRLSFKHSCRHSLQLSLRSPGENRLHRMVDLLLLLHLSSSFSVCVWSHLPLSMSLSHTFNWVSLACSFHVTMMPIRVVQALSRSPLRLPLLPLPSRLFLFSFDTNTSSCPCRSQHTSLCLCHILRDRFALRFLKHPTLLARHDCKSLITSFKSSACSNMPRHPRFDTTSSTYCRVS